MVAMVVRRQRAQRDLAAKTRRRPGCLAPGVTSTNDDYIELNHL